MNIFPTVLVLCQDPLRQLEYLESEPWLGRKPILHSPPHRPDEPAEIQPWSPPVVSTTMSTTGPMQVSCSAYHKATSQFSHL